MYKEKELRWAMVKNKKTIGQVANAMNLSAQGFANKLRGTREFSVSEVDRIVEILNLSDKERDDIFFTKDVE